MTIGYFLYIFRRNPKDEEWAELYYSRDFGWVDAFSLSSSFNTLREARNAVYDAEFREGYEYQYGKVFIGQLTIDSNNFVDVPLKRWRWLTMGDSEYKCPECRKTFDNRHNYCPNCGAKMIREAGEVM